MVAFYRHTQRLNWAHVSLLAKVPPAYLLQLEIVKLHYSSRPVQGS